MESNIEALTIEQKRSLLAKLLTRTHPPMRLSITQERLWQLDRLQPRTPLYNFQTALELHGRISARALEIAALQVVLRHEALQTCYSVEKGKPALSLSQPHHIAIAQHDLSGLAERAQAGRMAELGIADVRCGFDLAHPPLLRLTLVKLSAEKHRLYLTMHHIVSDFLSLDLFLFEMGACYTAVLEERPVNLPPMSASYQDFAEHQQKMKELGVYEEHLKYWSRALDGATALEWFSDYPRPAQASGMAGAEFFQISADTMRSIEAWARDHDATPYMVLMTAFRMLLHFCSGQEDLVVGSPTSGRIRSEYEALIGIFSYPLLIRSTMAGCHTFGEYLQRVRKVVLESATHADAPFAQVVDAVRQSSGGPGSLLRAMFSYVSRLRDLHFKSLECRRCPTNRGLTDLDLFMTVYPDPGEWHGVFEYNSDLFAPETIRTLIDAFIGILHSVLARPEIPLSELAALVPLRPPVRVAIAATFTAEPLLETLRFWMEELGLRVTPVIAPYNQLFQQLLAPDSVLNSDGSALNALLVRPEDWVRYSGADVASQKSHLASSSQEFIAAVRNAVPAMGCPLKIFLCPASPGLSHEIVSAVSVAERRIRQDLTGLKTVEVIDGLRIAADFAVEELHDPRSDDAANIPYKPQFYAALGTAIVRCLRSRIARPRKVLVLDCDNTLWKGLCAEDGPQGVVISEGHRALQAFALHQAETGTLVCLNSKNAPEHVFAVFRENPGMVLKEENISAFRINWEPKSSNMASMAAELNLATDSFVFIDDDAHECAEMMTLCPDILTFLLPECSTDFGRFLDNLWSFDRESISDEDRRRTALYRDNARRDRARRESSSLMEFLETLELRVDIRPAGSSRIERIAQLSQRTNQFNASGQSFSVFELQKAIGDGLEVLAVEVSDRFGDYGLVGAAMLRRRSDCLSVEAFYLSCRVLGRGVEHRVLSELGRMAQSSGLPHVHIVCRKTSRNQPFWHFMAALPGIIENRLADSCVLTLTVAETAQAKLVSADAAPAVLPKPSTAIQATPARDSVTLCRLPHDLATASQIVARLNTAGATLRKSQVGSTFAAPGNELEDAIAAEWKAVLRLDRVGCNDNFFELGGNSLLLVQLNSRIIGRFGADIGMPAMFQFPTVASLAKHMAGTVTGAVDASSRAVKSRAFLQQRKSQIAACRP